MATASFGLLSLPDGPAASARVIESPLAAAPLTSPARPAPPAVHATATTAAAPDRVAAARALTVAAAAEPTASVPRAAIGLPASSARPSGGGTAAPVWRSPGRVVAASVTPTTVKATNTTTLTVSGGKLVLGGKPYRDVGLNAYSIATYWGVNAGCGGMLTDTQLQTFLSEIPTHTLIRIWAFEGGMAVNVKTGQIDWAPLDRIVNAAAAHGDLLLMSLGDQAGTCDNQQWKTPAWYQSGYRAPAGTNAVGNTLPLTYIQYVQAVVGRYASSPAVGMWEPVNEPEASSCPPGYTLATCGGHQTCPDEATATAALRGFFDTVGGLIHSIDRVHPVESGLIGSGQCGTQGGDYQYVAASPGLDVLTVHDYYPATTALGGDQWNGIGERVHQSGTDGKPLIAGEVGVLAGAGAGCPTPSARAADYQARIKAQSAAGVQALLFWSWVPAPSPASCNYDVLNGDPTLKLLGQF